MFECSNCGKETDGCYIDSGKFYCNPKCANEHFYKTVDKMSKCNNISKHLNSRTDNIV